MAIANDLLTRRNSHFVLWRPSDSATAPVLVCGKFNAGNPPTLAGERQFAMTPAAGVHGLWELAAGACGFADGDIIHYWFVVEDTHPHRTAGGKKRCTDPTAHTVDWRLTAEAGSEPAAVTQFVGGSLTVCDPGGEKPDFTSDVSLDQMPTNNQLVIYELPAAWTRAEGIGQEERGVGSFRDVRAMVDETVGGANFESLPILSTGRSYLSELGVNALELLPPADSFFKREWGYDTAHFLAPDHDLGMPEGNVSSTANKDIADLVVACHRKGIRFFVDMVMAFGRVAGYETVDFDHFCIEDAADHLDDPDAKDSRGGIRDGFGSTLFRYRRPLDVAAYEPLSAADALSVPARQHMLTYQMRWMRDMRIDGIRMDSIENVANWDFIEAFKTQAHALWNERWASQGLGAGADARFLVVGEELTEPLALLTQGRLDGLWHDNFRALMRAALIGQTEQGFNFEDTVRHAIDCRLMGYSDGAKAVNYLTSHDVEGYRRERLFNFFQSSGITDIGRRVKLAFACLMTAVGIPMILAGEEFADQHDRFDKNGNVDQDGGKQVDPVNFNRLSDDWRQGIFQCVARLVKLRTTNAALGVNDTSFLHVDFDDGKRVLVWQRGGAGQKPVVVVANFSDFASDGGLAGEYVVPNWPQGNDWREVTQDRVVAAGTAGREPLFAWEAKVYEAV